MYSRQFYNIYFLFQESDISPLSLGLFMIVGAVLNLLAGIVTLIRYGQKGNTHIWVYITSYQHTDSKDIDLGLGLVALLAGAAMFAECVISYL